MTGDNVVLCPDVDCDYDSYTLAEMAEHVKTHEPAVSGEQWGEAYAAVYEVIRKYPPRSTDDYGIAAENARVWRAIEAAAPLIVADTRRKVADEIALAIEADAAELRLSTRPNNNPAEIAYAVGVEAGAVIARTHAIARGSGNGGSGQEGT